MVDMVCRSPPCKTVDGGILNPAAGQWKREPGTNEKQPESARLLAGAFRLSQIQPPYFFFAGFLLAVIALA